MPILELNYLAQIGGRASYIVANPGYSGILSTWLALAEDETAESRALDAAQILAEQLEALFRETWTVAESYPPTPLPEPPEPTQAELDKARFERRAIAHAQLSAEFGAWNLGRVRSGEFTGQQIDDWLMEPEIRGILDRLRLYSFERAIAQIQALPIEGCTTQAFKNEWVPKLQAAL